MNGSLRVKSRLKKKKIKTSCRTAKLRFAKLKNQGQPSTITNNAYAYPALTYSRLTMETREQCVKSV